MLKQSIMKIIYTTLMALGLIMPVMAQNRQVEESQITLNLLLPGVIYEAAVGDRSTMALEGTIGFQYVESSFSESGLSAVESELSPSSSSKGTRGRTPRGVIGGEVTLGRQWNSQRK